MNSTEQVNTAPAAPTAQRGRGGIKRAGYAPRRGAGQNRPAAQKAQLAKIGPNRLLETEWVKDSVLKGNVFVLFAGTGQSGDQQWTFHHPVGETPLDPRVWVATPTRDIGFLLQRRESEALTSWKRKEELAKRQFVLRLREGRKIGPDGETEVWVFENAPAIQPTIRSCMSAAKSAGKPESEWLSYADRAVQVAEQSFKEALRTRKAPSGWHRNNPRPIHETMGGPLGDQPQKAVPFLNGLSQAGAKDKVIRVAIGLDTSDPLDLPHMGDDEDSDDEAEAPITAGPSGNGGGQAKLEVNTSKPGSPPGKGT